MPGAWIRERFGFLKRIHEPLSFCAKENATHSGRDVNNHYKAPLTRRNANIDVDLLFRLAAKEPAIIKSTHNQRNDYDQCYCPNKVRRNSCAAVAITISHISILQSVLFYYSKSRNHCEQRACRVLTAISSSFVRLGATPRCILRRSRRRAIWQRSPCGRRPRTRLQRRSIRRRRKRSGGS